MTSKARRAALRRYMIECRDRLRLQAWDVEISDRDPDGEDAVLEIIPQPRRHLGKVRIGTFFDEDPTEQRQTVAHELMHLVDGFPELWIDFVDPDHEKVSWRSPLAPDVAAGIEDKVAEAVERAADFLARMVAPMLPKPPAWPK